MVTLSEGVRAPFPRYWLSGFLSDFGDGVRLAAFPLLAVHYTRSPAAVAAISARYVGLTGGLLKGMRCDDRAGTSRQCAAGSHAAVRPACR